MIDYYVGIYIRLSKEDNTKDSESESITNQRTMLINYANNNGYQIVKEYVDDGYSGTTFDRPGFKKLLCDIENNIINMVITKDLSRLGRDYIECGYYLEKYFPLNNIRYLAILDNIDTLKDNNDIVPFKAIINDWYAKDISKKVKSALRAKRSQGMMVSAKVCYGYVRDTHNKNNLMIVKEQSLIVRLIYSLCLKGYNLTSISNYLYEHNFLTPNGKPIWSSKTLKTILTNQMYIGDLIQNKTSKISYKSKKVIKLNKEEWTIIPNHHLPIVRKEEFITIQSLLGCNKSQINSNTSWLLNGFLFCYECGHKIGVNHYSSRKQSYLSCSYYKTHSHFKVCTPHTVNYNYLEKKILNYLTNLLKQVIDIDDCSLFLASKREHNDLFLKFKSLKKMLLYEYKNNAIDEEMYITKKQLLNNKISDLQKQIKDYQLIVKKIMENISRDLLIRLINKITITEDNHVTIFLNVSEYL